MRVDVCSCLLAFALGCNVAAGIIHKIIWETDSVTLRCPHSVEGKVTWSRERDGQRVKILTAGGDRDIIHIPDKGRYSSLTDRFKSLHIRSVTFSDSGTYWCNNESAVRLTVIPQGTTMHQTPERTTISLKCPHEVRGSVGPTWSRDSGEINSQRSEVSSEDQMLTIRDVQLEDSGLYYCGGRIASYLFVTKETFITHQIPERTTISLKCPHDVRGSVGSRWSKLSGDINSQRSEVSSVDQMLTIRDVKLEDSGWYYCGGKPAVYLFVTKGNEAPSTTTSTTTTTATTTTVTTTRRQTTANTDGTTTKGKRTKTTTERTTTTSSTMTPALTPSSAASHMWPMCVRTVIGVLYLIIMTSITVTTWRKARRIQRGHTSETEDDL